MEHWNLASLDLVTAALDYLCVTFAMVFGVIHIRNVKAMRPISDELEHQQTELVKRYSGPFYFAVIVMAPLSFMIKVFQSYYGQ